MSDDAERTHEPSLRQLAAELEALRRIMDERDRLYAERDTAGKHAVSVAIQAVREKHATIGQVIAIVLAAAAIVITIALARGGP